MLNQSNYIWIVLLNISNILKFPSSSFTFLSENNECISSKQAGITDELTLLFPLLKVNANMEVISVRPPSPIIYNNPPPTMDNKVYKHSLRKRMNRHQAVLGDVIRYFLFKNM